MASPRPDAVHSRDDQQQEPDTWLVYCCGYLHTISVAVSGFLHRITAPVKAIFHRRPKEMPGPKQRKIALVGSRSVGKSSMTVQFVDEHFVESYYPTIENTFSKTIKYKGQDYATEIIDTAGQDEYSILSSRHFIGIHGYMLVYSVSNKQSFDMIRVIRDRILNHLGAEWVPIVIVGNKSDLRPEQRQVTTEEGRQLGAEMRCGWTEASARYNENVNKAFELMIAEIEKAQNPSEPTGGNKCEVM
ncbi:MAG: GTP-binding protein [Peltula sp. TS41687]|nr:MAG: GTP-binding protein [Peltula sp. TS41687]